MEIVTAIPLIATVDTFYNIDSMQTSINVSGEVYAPIEEGQKLGEATYTIYGQQYTVDLIAKNAVEMKPEFDLLQFISNILIFLLRLLIICAIIILFIRFINHSRKKKKRKHHTRNVRRYNARFHK